MKDCCSFKLWETYPETALGAEIKICDPSRPTNDDDFKMKSPDAVTFMHTSEASFNTSWEILISTCGLRFTLSNDVKKSFLEHAESTIQTHFPGVVLINKTKPTTSGISGWAEHENVA